MSERIYIGVNNDGYNIITKETSFILSTEIDGHDLIELKKMIEHLAKDVEVVVDDMY